MRSVPNQKAELYRIMTGPLATRQSDGNNGAFEVRMGHVTLFVIVSDEGGWDHVSVSTSQRCPTWEEMAYIKRLFFRDEETVVQFHPKASEYVDCHPRCLHMWRDQKAEHELPPSWMVGPKKREEPQPPPITEAV